MVPALGFLLGMSNVTMVSAVGLLLGICSNSVSYGILAYNVDNCVVGSCLVSHKLQWC